MLPENAARDLLAQAAETVEVSRRTGDAVVAVARRRRRARIAAVTVATAAAVLGIVAVGRAHPLAAPAPLPAASPSVAPSESPGDRVPILAGHPEAEALKRAQQWGLTADVVPVLRQCRPAGWVVGQRPRVGSRVPDGTAVTIAVTTEESGQGACSGGVAFESDRRTASLLYRFSRGEQATPPSSPEVSLGLAGTDVTVRLRGSDTTDRERWRVAPSGSPDQAVDVLGPLAATDGDYRVDLTPRPGCPDADEADTGGYTGLRQLSITPASGGCDWAVDVSVNEVGQIESVVLDRASAPSGPTNPAGARPCRADDVTARFRPEGEGAGGHMITWARFRNVSDSTCVLEGYPRRVVASEPGLPDVEATDGGFFPGEDSSPMAPGETTDLGLETATACEARPGGGPPGPMYHHVTVELPGGTVSLVAQGRSGFDVTCGLRADRYLTSQDP